MPRSVLDIAVDDTQFRRFLDLYQGYHESLSKMSGFWSDASKAAAGAEASTGSMVETLAAGAASGALVAEALEKAEGSAVRASAHMGRIATSAKDAATSILHATESLAKWAVLSLGAGLLGGSVGLFGLDRLAESVSGQRKSALGLGITSAEAQAFDVNYGTRLTGPGFLQNVQDIKSDLAQSWQFTQLGIRNPGEADTAELGVDVIRRARDLWQKAGPGGHNVQMMQAQGLSGLMDFNTWQRIGQASPAELAQYEGQYRRDVRTMGASNQTQIEWQNFAIQMKRAADQIESVFVKGLEPLIPGLTHFSESIERALAGFLGNPHMKEWIEGLGKAIEHFATYVGSEAFQENIRTFVDDIAYAAQKMTDVLRLLGLLPSAPEVFTGSDASDSTLPYPSPKNQTWGQWLGFGKTQYDFSDIEKLNGLPRGTLAAVGMQESGLNPNVRDSAAGAQGPFQFMPGTQKAYNITDPHSMQQESNAAGMYLRDILRMKGIDGDIAKALAGYNWGPERVQKDVATYGDAWRQHLPPETSKYLNDILPKIHVQVSVTNQTGANVAIVANSVRQ